VIIVFMAYLRISGPPGATVSISVAVSGRDLL
jgi:hypothetical protein